MSRKGTRSERESEREKGHKILLCAWTQNTSTSSHNFEYVNFSTRYTTLCVWLPNSNRIDRPTVWLYYFVEYTQQQLPLCHCAALEQLIAKLRIQNQIKIISTILRSIALLVYASSHFNTSRMCLVTETNESFSLSLSPPLPSSNSFVHSNARGQANRNGWQ